MQAYLSKLVRERAGLACEYCRLTQADSSIPFEIDHIIARKHGGLTGSEARRDHWNDHFYWSGPILMARSPVGRATVAVLAINAPDLIELRTSLLQEGRSMGLESESG